MNAAANLPDGPVIVGLSGGVDSAVAALLLLEQGYEVQGLFMSNWDEQDTYCTQAQDYQDARAVARVLGIALHRVNFAGEYRSRVFEYFLAEHRAGRTPNPDVLCNREVKFGVALRHALRLGARYFATGHYARLRHGGQVQLLKAVGRGEGSDLFPACRARRRSGPRADADRRLHQGAGARTRALRGPAGVRQA